MNQCGLARNVEYGAEGCGKAIHWEGSMKAYQE